MTSIQNCRITYLGRCLAAILAVFLVGCGGAGSVAPNDSSTPDLSPGQRPQGTIYTNGTALLASNGKPLVLRGINLQYGDNPSERLDMIEQIASTGANAIRLELRKDTSERQLRAALDAIVARRMVAVVMYWEEDVTCQKGGFGFAVAMSRWTKVWRSVLSDPKYRPYLILNIANEWGSAEQASSYRETYQAAIKSLRQAGYQFPLMIDAAGCGQDYSVFANGGAKAIADADPFSNVIFSVHAYWSYQNAAAINAAARTLQDAGYPFVWGEFGQADFQANIGKNTDHRALIQAANAQRTGYLAWSWYGNGSDAKVLDLSTNGKAASLTPYGREVVEGTEKDSTRVDGIRATSVLIGE